MLDYPIHKPDRSYSEQKKITIAYFITPHGFGHAARAAAIMAALYDLNHLINFEIYTLTPGWFFQDSLGPYFKVHPLKTDIGLIQKSPLEEDLPATLQSLDEFIPFESILLNKIAEEILNLECQLVLCDIAPLGIAIALKAGLPSVLIENFTWDWIYQGYLHEYSKFNPFITYLKDIFSLANFHIQTEPICEPDAKADLITLPVCRKSRLSKSIIRDSLSIPEKARVVLITMGGIQTDYRFITRLRSVNDYYFVIPGIGDNPEMENNLILLPHHSTFYHPDLVNACDAVIGKTGYSTVSEVYSAGIPYGFVSRSNFRESSILADFIRKHMQGFEISEQDFCKGNWVSRLPELLSNNRIYRNGLNGANQAAQFILGLLIPDQS
ncbi:MAG TPA: glycosyltransferase family protein [Anaerolineaceae bacterium]|nr:glycosyltransferase family protein [Anaerolineaceae bacterium]